jgi:cation diffusion facilitator CzcD-associated flavoprotein CzcO
MVGPGDRNGSLAIAAGRAEPGGGLMTDVGVQAERSSAGPATEVDVIVVGAGFSGLYALHRLRGIGLTVRVFEQADDVGGTWYWNRYPGARCDVESLDYSYSFSSELEQEWEWTERYPTQPEILRYLRYVADRFDLRHDIQFNTRITSATFDDGANRWVVTTADGERWSARIIIPAVGCLSSRLEPRIEGLETFRGAWYHTAAWPKEGVDFTGKRVGVVGTGSTGIQVIPQVARQADHLYVFQRTPNFSVPAQNRPLAPEVQAAMKARYREHRQEARESAFGVPAEPNPRSALEVTAAQRVQELDRRWQHGGGATMLLAFADLLVDERANEAAAEYVRGRIREIVDDPQVAEMLCPTDHPIGTKRICVDIDYYETYNRDNVTLVDIRQAPIGEITPQGVRLADGREFDVDVIVFAIGFDAMTGALFDMNICGRDGVRLQDKWADGPRTYLGLATSGFPNLFMITGPGSPSVLSNMVVSLEQHVDWLTDLLAYAREQGFDRVEATREAEDAWCRHCSEVANATLFPRARSWYTGQNVPGKPFVFMPYVGGVGVFRQVCEEIATKGCEGFAFDRVETPVRQRPSKAFAVGGDATR